MTLINRTPTSVLYRYNVGVAVSTQTLVIVVGMFFCGSVGRSVGLCVGRSVGRSVCRSVGRSVCVSVLTFSLEPWLL